jgi:hypothetical protein
MAHARASAASARLEAAVAEATEATLLDDFCCTELASGTAVDEDALEQSRTCGENDAARSRLSVIASLDARAPI